MKRRLSKLFKAPPDDLDDLLLLFLRHLVVAGQAQTSFKDVRTHVLHAAGNVGVGLCPALAGDGDEAVHPVHGLHVLRDAAKP